MFARTSSLLFLIAAVLPAVLSFAPSGFAPALKGANVIIQMDQSKASEQVTSSGIMIAATVKSEGPKTGVVAAVGSGWHTETGAKVAIDEVKVGDKVMFREPSSMEARKMKVPEGEFYVLSVNDILAKIN